MKEALIITVTGLLVVFLGLSILFFVFSIMSKLLGKERKTRFELKTLPAENLKGSLTEDHTLKTEAIISAVLSFIMSEDANMLEVKKTKWKMRGWKEINVGWKATAGMTEFRRGVRKWSEDLR